jgi:hypothetical protein
MTYQQTMARIYTDTARIVAARKQMERDLTKKVPEEKEVIDNG